MDVLNRLPPPNDAVRKMLDNMLDDDQIDSATYVVAFWMLPREPLQAICDSLTPTLMSDWGGGLSFVTSKSRGAVAPQVLDMADRVIAELPNHMRSELGYLALVWLKEYLDSMAEHMGSWAFEDSFVGGCLQPWKRGRQIRVDHRGRPYKRTHRRLFSPDFIGRYVKRLPETASIRALADRTLKRILREKRLTPGLMDFADRLAQEREEFRRDEIERYLGQVEAARKREVSYAARRAFRKQVRRDRAQIKRALHLASSMLPSDTVRAFVRGEQVRLPGQMIDLLVKPAKMLSDGGMGALEVQAAAKDGPPLARLCTYVEDTPVIDQLTAFSLAMRAGEEADVIEKANVIRYLPGAETNPILAAKRGFRSPVQPARVILRGDDIDPYWSSRTSVDEHRNHYMDRMLPAWRERVEVAALGPRVKQYRAGLQAINGARSLL